MWLALLDAKRLPKLWKLLFAKLWLAKLCLAKLWPAKLWGAKLRGAKLRVAKLRFANPPPKWPPKPNAEASLGTARAVAPSNAAVPSASIEMRLHVGLF